MKSIRLILGAIFLLFLIEVSFHIYQQIHRHPKNVLIFYQVVKPVSYDKTDTPKQPLKDMVSNFGYMISGALISGIIGLGFAWLQDFFRTRKDRRQAAESRRINFIAEMNRIRHQASFVSYDSMGEFYKDLLPQISYQAGLVRGDFSHVASGFDECLIALYRLDETKISEPQIQMPIMQVIDSFIGFVERNHKKGQ